MIHAVIFDMDGVIFDSERLIMECWEQLGEIYHLKQIHQVLIECIGTNAAMTREIVLSHYGQDFPYEDFCKKSSTLFHERADHGLLPQKKGICELLSFLKEHQIPTAVASSTRSEIVKKELLEGGLLSFFDEIIGGDMVEKSKPEPDIFLKACDALRAKPSDCFIIEDSFNGIRAAHAAGARGIMVPDLVPPDKEMEEKAEIILPSLLEVKDYLEKLL